MKKLIFPILFFCISITTGSAQEREKTCINLKECLSIGLEKNYGIQIARNNEEITKNDNSLGNAGFLPTIDLTAGYDGSLYNYEKKITDTGVKNTYNNVNDNDFNADLGLNWTIFDGMKMQATKGKLKELQKLGELNTRIAVESLISDILVAYNDHIFQLQKLKNMEATVNLSKERVRIVKARYQIGAMSHLELKQAEVDLNSDMSRLITQKEAFRRSIINLNKLLCIEPIEVDLANADSTISLLPTLEFDKLKSEAEQWNADLLVSATKSNISVQDLKIARSEYYPYLRLNASYGYDKNYSGLEPKNTTQKMGLYYGATIGFNLFNGLDSRRKIRNTKLAQQNEALSDLNIRLELKAILSSLYLSYTNNIELKEMEAQNLVIAKEYYETSIDKYKLGSLSGLELREAQVSLQDAEERLLLAIYNIKLCEISLKQVSGKISEYMEGV